MIGFDETAIRAVGLEPGELAGDPVNTYIRLYLHLFSWPFRHVHLDGLADRVEYAQLLNDGSEIKMVSNSFSFACKRGLT